ncbi:uncharacterized protein L3040_007221 [Drepanopeziza brunnea f. sp. 'multigermtubi']|uniref:Uncharacterized protein n=1 Tax=Marssonina brunnea f. sp. multigermtubi (strain MB_m1) TaxID=1072389 RepID=K1XE39_MARBU|nr:uncharacterized protein MBM_02345 [Drepanopeziza brunnea f. sp. 'multigermtubi' MB_m1]EKD19108.1 hypothetical protein MBM_02345 [Drepanopeziza brunnea f. sp. 'multigermtubi' MB_m1]KAJ5038356.1 hypothetical protein L3040_007221 [Drepanopeziza brunnea f. sp. 'multigermtubi']
MADLTFNQIETDWAKLVKSTPSVARWIAKGGKPPAIQGKPNQEDIEERKWLKLRVNWDSKNGRWILHRLVRESNKQLGCQEIVTIDKARKVYVQKHIFQGMEIDFEDWFIQRYSGLARADLRWLIKRFQEMSEVETVRMQSSVRDESEYLVPEDWATMNPKSAPQEVGGIEGTVALETTAELKASPVNISFQMPGKGPSNTDKDHVQIVNSKSEVTIPGTSENDLPDKAQIEPSQSLMEEKVGSVGKQQLKAPEAPEARVAKRTCHEPRSLVGVGATEVETAVDEAFVVSESEELVHDEFSKDRHQDESPGKERDVVQSTEAAPFKKEELCNQDDEPKGGNTEEKDEEHEADEADEADEQNEEEEQDEEEHKDEEEDEDKEDEVNALRQYRADSPEMMHDREKVIVRKYQWPSWVAFNEGEVRAYKVPDQTGSFRTVFYHKESDDHHWEEYDPLPKPKGTGQRFGGKTSRKEILAATSGIAKSNRIGRKNRN